MASAFNQLRRQVAELQELLPVGAKHALMCVRRRGYWRRAGVVFVHIPKAAGTSVAKALYGRSLGHMSAQEIRRYSPDLFWRLPSFAISRNPWDRLVSAYTFVRQQGTLVAGVRHPERYRTPEFRSFASFVEEWLVEHDLTRVDYVFQPQYSFVCDRKGLPIVDFIGATERMADVEDFLRDAAGFAGSIPGLNASDRPRSYRDYYDRRLANLVGDLYSADVRLFNYEF